MLCSHCHIWWHDLCVGSTADWLCPLCDCKMPFEPSCDKYNKLVVTSCKSKNKSTKQRKRRATAPDFFFTDQSSPLSPIHTKPATEARLPPSVIHHHLLSTNIWVSWSVKERPVSGACPLQLINVCSACVSYCGAECNRKRLPSHEKVCKEMKGWAFAIKVNSVSAMIEARTVSPPRSSSKRGHLHLCHPIKPPQQCPKHQPCGVEQQSTNQLRTSSMLFFIYTKETKLLVKVTTATQSAASPTFASL